MTAASTSITQTNDTSSINEPHLVIKKRERKLLLFDGTQLVKTYKIALGFSPKGTKEAEGDGRTPEGEYYVFTKNPESRFHLSLGISYPGKDDAKRGFEKGLISQEEHDEIVSAINEKRMPLQKTKLGGEIYIHGGGNDRNWTDGCIALSDKEMAQLFDTIPVGAKVTVLP